MTKNESPASMDVSLERAIGMVQWLDDLLDMARDRQDPALARLIGDLMDDLQTGATTA